MMDSPKELDSWQMQGLDIFEQIDWELTPKKTRISLAARFIQAGVMMGATNETILNLLTGDLGLKRRSRVNLSEKEKDKILDACFGHLIQS